MSHYLASIMVDMHSFDAMLVPPIQEDETRIDAAAHLHG